MNRLEFTPFEVHQQFGLTITENIDIEPYELEPDGPGTPLTINDPRVTQVLQVYAQYEPILRGTTPYTEEVKAHYFKIEQDIGLCVTILVPLSAADGGFIRRFSSQPGKL